MAKFPARDGDHSIGLEVIEVFAECLDGIEIVFAEGERPGCGRGPGVDQGHLHDIELLWSGTQERPAVGDMNMHVGPLVEMLGVVGVTLAHDGGRDDGIDLDPGYAGTAVCNRAQDIDAAPGPDDGVLPCGRKTFASAGGADMRSLSHSVWCQRDTSALMM